MPQSLLLKGVKDVVNYTTTDGTFPLRLKQNLRGGSTFQIKQWWAKKGNNTVYNSCTVFEIVGSDNYVVIPTSTSTQLGIGYDGDVYSMTFSNYNEVDRVAIFNVNDLLICEYLFPSVSGGTIAKRTVVPQPYIGDVGIQGTRNPVVGVDNDYTVSFNGNASDATYLWTTTDSGATITDPTSATPSIEYSAADVYTTTCKVTSVASTDSPVTKNISVTATDPITIGTATVSGPTDAYTGQAETYSVSFTGNADDATYIWTTADNGATITNGTSVNAQITFSAIGNFNVKCTVSSITATPGTVETTPFSVGVTTQILLGTTSIGGPTEGDQNEELSYSANYTGNAQASDVNYSWTIAPIVEGAFGTPGQKTTTLTLPDVDIYTISCLITSDTAGDAPQTPTQNLTISAP